MDSISHYVPYTICAGVIIGVTAAAGALYRRYRRRPGGGWGKPPRHVKNFQPDMVYLFEFPASLNIASMSPFSLKVATWLRMHRIRYESIRGVDKWSHRGGQLPFIELNGEQVSDSEVIVEHLATHFDVPAVPLSPEQRAVGHMLQRMLDNHTCLSYGYYRYVEATKRCVDTWTFAGAFTRRLICVALPRDFRAKAYHNGIGRLDSARISGLGIRDFRAASELLGDKTWVLGDDVGCTMADAVLFAHTCQVIDIPVEYPHRAAMSPNLIAHCERVKRQFWPDWDELVREAQNR